MHKVTVYIPGLFHFIPEYSTDDLKHLKTIRSILNLGLIKSITPLPYLEQIAKLFAIEPQAKCDVPYAAISRLQIDDMRPQNMWMFIEPVYLKPTSNGLVLYDSYQMALNRHDILTVASLVNDLFSEYSYEIELPDNERWYLKLPGRPNIKTYDIYQVAGNDIANFLPSGKDEQHWIQLFNEIQMRLFDSTINKQREQKGELPINSLWFWGAGELPRSLVRKWSVVFSDESMVESMCMLSSTECLNLTEFSKKHDIRDDSEVLIILPDALQSMQYDEPAGWLETIIKIDSDWLQPLMNQLKQGTINHLTVITDRYQIELEYRFWLKLWHWQRPIHSFFESNI